MNSRDIAKCYVYLVEHNIRHSSTLEEQAFRRPFIYNDILFRLFNNFTNWPDIALMGYETLEILIFSMAPVFKKDRSDLPKSIGGLTELARDLYLEAIGYNEFLTAYNAFKKADLLGMLHIPIRFEKYIQNEVSEWK